MLKGARMATRVHLADDHTMFRQGLQSILSSQEGIEVVSASSTGEEAAERVRRTKPDVIVTQLDMQPKTAEEIISGLREASPGSRIVVLTLWDNLRYVQAVSRMSIDALMHKSSSAEELIATIGAIRKPGAARRRRIHRSAWKGSSQKFGCRGFSEVARPLSNT
jgi:DNA-binding NarL/FixJ family response regulator